MTVNSLQELRDMLDQGQSAEQRGAISATLEAQAPAGGDALAAAWRRIDSYVLGDGELSDSDRELVKGAFPMTVTAVSATDKTLGPGEVWDLGTSTSPVTVNLGTLTMQPGSAIRIQNTVLSFTVDTLVRNSGGGGSENYDIGVFGATGADGNAGGVGTAGGAGGTGKSGTCKSPGISGDDGGAGGAGNSGGGGGVGGVGGDGRPALTATIKITGSLTGTAGQLVVATRSGTGGIGGPGGAGGAGGAGGSGGHGAECGCETTDGGDGGQGGSGGQGGNGGTGGSGTSGNPVYVTVPVPATGMINRVRLQAPAGAGGTGGVGGQPGAGGSGGGSDKHATDGGHGSSGSAGSPGSPGGPGSQSGAPGLIYVNGSGG